MYDIYLQNAPKDMNIFMLKIDIKKKNNNKKLNHFDLFRRRRG